MQRNYELLQKFAQFQTLLCKQRSESTYSRLREQCKRFARQELQPVAAALDCNGTFPKEQIEKLAQMGIMGITAPIEYGGSNLDMRSLAVAVEELSRGCASTGAIVSIHNILYADLLTRYGTKTQKHDFLNPYTGSGIPGAFALSESEAGSDVANIATTAHQCGNTFILNGTKSWVTSGQQAEIAIIFAKLTNSENNIRGLAGFLVPLNSSGVSVIEMDEKLGIRATSTCEIHLADVIVPSSNVIGDLGAGFKIAMEQLNRARVGIAAQALGIAQSALDLALYYATNRRAFNQHLSEMQAVQHRLSRMATRIVSDRLLIWQAALSCDTKPIKDSIKYCSMAKLSASETATFATHQCIQILGGVGFTKGFPAERYYRDARITEIYGGVSDIQLSLIAERVLKEFSQYG